MAFKPRKMRLLVVSFAFPPFNSIGGVRVGKTVKYLLAHGHDVRVLTSSNQPFPRTLPLEVPPQNVVYTRYLNVRRPVELAHREGAQAAATNASSGVVASGGGLRRGLGFFVRTFVYFPDANVGWLAYAIRDAGKLLRGWTPDLILASSPPPTGLVLARRLSRKVNVPWVADLRDLWVDHQNYHHRGWRKAIEEKFERRVLSSAAGFVTVSAPLAETLVRKYGKPTTVVLNGFDPSDYGTAEADSSDATAHTTTSETAPRKHEPLRIVYTGVVYDGSQDPAPLFQALKLLGDEADAVRIVFCGSYLGGVRDLAARHDVSHLVEISPPVPYQDSLRMQRDADVLLLLLWTDAAQRGVYTGKLFEYVGARRPILAIGPGRDVAAEFIIDRDAGFVTNDAPEIARLLRNFIGQKRQTGSVPATPERTTEGVTREEQVRLLEHFLSGLLNESQRRASS